MSKGVSINPANSLSVLYGKGVFTTIAIRNWEPFLWEKHWRRLSSNAAKLEIDISAYDERSVLNALAGVIENNKVTNGRARITFLDESPGEIWSSPGEKKTSLSIITAGPRKIPDMFKLTISPHRVNTTSPLLGIKSCNYLEHLMVYDEAKGCGFEEAVRLNERGEIASACLANIFWVKGEKFYTPSLKTGCLAGTTREFVFEKLDCEQVELGLDALNEVEAIFLTSAGVGVAVVSEFNGKRLLTNHLKLFTEEIRSLFFSG